MKIVTMSMETNDSPALQALRDAGYKLTGPRLTILDILEQSGGHITSAELLKRVEEHDPTIGRASVFRTLDLMIQLGIVWTSTQGSATVHYMLMPGGHHHHALCKNCYRLIEFEDCQLGPLIAKLELEYGFQIDGHLLELYGLCQDCQDTALDKPNQPE